MNNLRTQSQHGFPEKLSWCWNEQVCQRVKCKGKRFERFNGLDAALYKHIPLPSFLFSQEGVKENAGD